MREITTHHNSPFTRDHIKVYAVDEPGSGGACHRYAVCLLDERGLVVGEIILDYQHGPLNEAGINGIADEGLLAVVADRLEAFALGEFSSVETKMALHHVKSAMEWMAFRQKERDLRGVAGRLEK